MALSGTFYGTTANDNIISRIDWSATQDVVGNYSDITATLSYSRTNTGYTTEGYWKGSLTIGDSTGKASSVHLKITHNSNTVAITHKARVYHDSYGKCSVNISAAGAITNPSTSTLKSTSISAEVTPDTIARASTVSAVDADIGSRSTVVISRKNDSFTHSLHYRFGSCQGYISSAGLHSDREEQMTATTVNFLLPETFYSQIPNDPYGVGTLTCRTYWGGTLIGTETAKITAKANERLCRPAVSGSVADINPVTLALTGDAGVLVRYLSTARCTVAASAKNGASITKTTIGGTVADTLDVCNAAFDSLVFTAVDSRGYSSDHTTALSVIPYVLLTNNATVQRTDPTSGNALLTLQGSCWQGNFGQVENTLHASYQVGSDAAVELQPAITDNNTYYVEIPLTGLAYTQSYPVTVTVWDGATRVVRTLKLNRGLPVFHWGEQDFQFEVPVAFNGGITGKVSGVYMRTVRLSGTDTFTVQTRFAGTTGSGRQSWLLFGFDNGMLVSGVIGYSSVVQEAYWSGTEGVSASVEGGGLMKVTLASKAYDFFTLISAERFEIV